MMRFWIGVALLAGSWMLGLDYFFPVSGWAWLATVAAAVGLLSGAADRQIESLPPRLTTFAMILFLPALWFADGPYRAAPLLIVLGLAVRLLPLRRRWVDSPADGAVVSGVILLVQSLVLGAYANHTSQSHDLPPALAQMLAAVASMLGIDAAADGSSVVMHSMRQVHRFGATWELLLDPVTLLFFAGGCVMLGFRAVESHPLGERWKAWLRAFRILTLLIVCWLPVRAGLMMALYLHRVLRSDPDRALHAMNHLFSPWVLLAFLAAPVLLAWWFVPLGNAKRRSQQNEEPNADPIGPAASPMGSIYAAAALIGLAVGLFTAAIDWNPVGVRREGRVMVVERHSEWEPTTKPYDTTWFVEPKYFDEGSGYNYALIYRYLEQYYKMSRLLETDKIDDAKLAECDVLVIKTPTIRYSLAEIAAVLRFVERGGGLLMIGDHTNYERSGTILNDIARPMGFTFRDDLLFGFGDTPYEQQTFRPAAASHPIVQHMPPMDFAVSCSVDPGWSRGRSVITSSGLWSMGPEYHHDNYHPIPQHCPEMRYGPFVQVWAAQYGKGRVVAFTDSTIFSNFCTFQPGKAELMLGMVEWLNHAAPWLDPRLLLLLLGLPPLVMGVRVARGLPSAWLVFLAAGACGWVVASLAVAGMHRWAMPVPECLRPLYRVVIDRTVSNAPLSKGAYTTGDNDGYGLFEQWISRLGGYTVRKEGDEAFSGDALVVFCPNRSVTEEYREGVIQFVREGGRLLVIDSPENVGSTANSLLWPFGLSIHHDRAWKGKLTSSGALPVLDVANAYEISGGQPIGKLDKLPVAAVNKFGKGAVMAIGCGSLWNDAGMGETWTVEPEATEKARYEVLFAWLRLLFSDTPLPGPPLKTEKAPLPELPMTESGPAEM